MWGSTASAQVTLYVDGDATGTPIDGSSWARAYRTLQDALDDQSLSDDATIFVAAANQPYRPTAPSSGLAAAKSFLVNLQIRLYGGFNVPASVTPDSARKRNPLRHPTILSGDNTALPSNPGHSQHVVFIPPVNDGCQLDGFVVEGGRAESLIVSENEFPEDGGGGIAILGSAVVGSSTPVIQNCVVRDNFALRLGGGILAHGKNETGEEGVASPYVRSTSILDNEARDDSAGGSATGNGGGIAVEAGTLHMMNCVVASNRSGQHGGGVYGGSIARVLMHNCTVVDNRTDPPCEGGPSCFPIQYVAGVYTLDDFNEPETEYSWFVNCIIWGNDNDDAPVDFDDQIGVLNEQNPLIEYQVHHSCIQDLPAQSPSNGNFDADPLFVASTDYRLQCASPCIGAGSVNPVGSATVDDVPVDTYDVDNDDDLAEATPDRNRWPRVYPTNGEIDVGAFEFRCLREDLTGDVFVDGADMSVVLGEWSTDCYICLADFTGDGVVNGADLAILLGAWGTDECDSCGGQSAMALAGEGDSSLESYPQGVAEMLGFASLQEFCEWIDELGASERDAILTAFFGSGGGA